MKFLIILAITCSFLMPSVFAESDITIMTDSDSYEYGEIVKISGIILTKYDTSASGGTLISIAEKTKLPIVAIGVGEKINDLVQFESKKFSKDILEK